MAIGCGYGIERFRNGESERDRLLIRERSSTRLAPRRRNIGAVESREQELQ